MFRSVECVARCTKEVKARSGKIYQIKKDNIIDKSQIKYFQSSDYEQIERDLIVVRYSMLKQTWSDAHDRIGSHCGIDKTAKNIKRDFYMKQTWKFVTWAIDTCRVCQGLEMKKKPDAS